MTDEVYASAFRAYREAINNLRKPASDATERSAGGTAPSASETDLEKLAQRSEELRIVLSSAVTSDDPDLRDLAGLKLLAAAAYDLALVEDLATGGQEVERSASAIFTSPELKEILDAPLMGATMKALATVERERAPFPTQLRPARDTLCDMVELFITDITDRSATGATTAITNALNFGLGPLQQALSAITQEVAAFAPTAVTTFVR